MITLSEVRQLLEEIKEEIVWVQARGELDHYVMFRLRGIGYKVDEVLVALNVAMSNVASIVKFALNEEEDE